MTPDALPRGLSGAAHAQSNTITTGGTMATRTVAYFIQSRPAPSQPWQQASGVKVSWESRDKALSRLADRRDRQPNWEHRLMERITTVTDQPADEKAQR